MTGLTTVSKISVLLLLLCCGACGNKKLLQYNDYVQWLQEPENKLVQYKDYGGIRLKLQYLPADYLVYNELKTASMNTAHADSLKKNYNYSLNFMLSFLPPQGEQLDVTKAGVKDQEEFSQRIGQLAFNMGPSISLTCGNKSYSPELTQLERLFGLRNSADIQVVFNLNKDSLLKSGNNIDIEYSDAIFNTGLSKFSFPAEALRQAPGIDFEHKQN